MVDFAREWTDAELEALELRIHGIYAQAANEMQDKLESWMSDYESQRRGWEKAVKAGIKTKGEFDNWLSDRAMERTWQENMVNQLSMDALNADVQCRQMVNDEIPSIFAENANMQAYSICRATGLDLQFTIYDRDAVRFLLTDPKIYPTVNVTKDLQWNQKKLNSAVMQSILQGESIPNMAKRLKGVFLMDERAATTVARTSVTYVEAMAKRHSMIRAKGMGIPMKQKWNALHDGRTRYEHRQMDGVTVEVGAKFDVDGYQMDGPGDPSAPARLVMNCRCGLTAEIDFDGMTPAFKMHNEKFPPDVSYEDWKSGIYRTDAEGNETEESKRERYGKDYKARR